MGDFNSRTGAKNEFENDVSVSNAFTDETNFLRDLSLLKRVSADKHTNVNGNCLLELCKSFDLRLK